MTARAFEDGEEARAFEIEALGLDIEVIENGRDDIEVLDGIAVSMSALDPGKRKISGTRVAVSQTPRQCLM